ncbi:hypothetical protein ABVF61_31410 [Roseibium sp. HPY-6]|uniref:hypothetical protein n=1 Tax=Roseibium sp. HPY-6 TaxID=3229852 RepID=UPI00338EE9DD
MNMQPVRDVREVLHELIEGYRFFITLEKPLSESEQIRINGVETVFAGLKFELTPEELELIDDLIAKFELLRRDYRSS